MRPFVLLALLLACSCAAQDPAQPVVPAPPGHESERRLPNGKLQSEEIVKADYEKSMKDVRQLVELSQSLETDMEKETSQVVSLGDLKKLDEIEKIAKRIRGRIRRF
jgi:hypothetical protein